MSPQALTFVVVALYLGIAAFGWAVCFVSINLPRYWPVVSLLGLALGVPTVGLLVIRMARIVGYASNPNDISQQATLLIAFGFSFYCCFQAFVLVYQERQRVIVGRRCAVHPPLYAPLPPLRLRAYRTLGRAWDTTRRAIRRGIRR